MDKETDKKQAKLIAVEDGLAEFVLGSIVNEDDSNVFFWPEEHLPQGIEAGDEVVVSLDFKNKEEKTVQIKQKQEKELKQDEMRKLLEELVN
ncbi:hypothetical protein ACFLZH_01935 [Patescibacteria group bacterium]